MRSIATLEGIPLPQDSAQHCCWQLLQQLNIQHGDSSFKLQGVVLHQPEKLSLILLDAVNRRLASIHHDGADVRTEQNPEIEAELPGRLLMASIYLAYWSDEAWQSALANSPWKIRSHKGTRTLAHQNRDVLSVDKPQFIKPAANTTFIVRHHLIDFTAEITTLQQQNLQEPML